MEKMRWMHEMEMLNTTKFNNTTTLTVSAYRRNYHPLFIVFVNKTTTTHCSTNVSFVKQQTSYLTIINI